MNRRGFTIIELMTVIVIIGILATISTLRYIDLRDEATAAKISSEIDAVRLAAYNYWADHESFPPDAAAGVKPPELVDYTRGALHFTNSDYTLDWDSFPGGGGAYRVGLTITADNTHLQNTVIRMFGDKAPFFRNGSSLTYIIVGPDGEM
jgi:prepilin-type N-terminal cleavage/methylation domain-containing protein